jgi:hypothetical protein
VLSERERRILARIERRLTESDPALARLLSTGSLPRNQWPSPTALLVLGLGLMVLGGLVAAVPVAVLGMALTVLAMFTAHRCPTPTGP